MTWLQYWTYSKHTLNTLWAHSEQTLNTLWTHSEHTLKKPWTHSEYTLNTLWAHSEYTMSTLWAHSDDMPKIWQNLKNINQWLTHSPTWIQEMLAHLKTFHGQGQERWWKIFPGRHECKVRSIRVFALCAIVPPSTTSQNQWYNYLEDDSFNWLIHFLEPKRDMRQTEKLIY